MSSDLANVVNVLMLMLICQCVCAIGLLRGIDPVKKLFYITTPLRDSRLDSVNVFVLGNPDSIKFEMVR